MSAGVYARPLDAGEPIRNATCECGNTKRPGKTACDRCTYLDGTLPSRALVIAALRGTDGLSLRELCVVMYGSYSRSKSTGVLKLMQRLLAERRVRRYEQECDVFESGGFCDRGSTGPRWIYALDGLAERAWSRRQVSLRAGDR